MYTKEQVKTATRSYFNDNELATDVWMSKYALKNKAGEFLEKTPDDMHHRLAREFARIEQKYPNPLSEDEIFELFKNFEFIIPQGSPMSAIGNTEFLETTSSCFVVDSPFDAYSGILHTDQEQAQLMKRRGGVGFDISTIRPKGTNTNNAAKTSDGIGIFMERYSNTTREVAQNGRRGALMLTCSVKHPEAEVFATIKQDTKKVTGANISLALTDEFMEAVESNGKFTQQFPIYSSTPLVSKEIVARELWNKIIYSAWKCAEPGLAFFDTITDNTPSDAYELYKTIACNPCSEIWMCANDSCRLMVLNLVGYVHNAFTNKARFDYELFQNHVRKAMRLMDDLIDIEIEHIDRILAKIETDPEPDHIKLVEKNLWINIRQNAINIRRAGLGITGLGDCLAGLNIVYGSKESIETTESIYKLLELSAYESSIELAMERGSFPKFNFEAEMKHKFLYKIYNELNYYSRTCWEQYGRRNIAITTTAPTGSVSILAKSFSEFFGTTSGIEPCFEPIYRRRRKINNVSANTKIDFVDKLGDKWQEYDVYHPGHQYAVELDSANDIYLKSKANSVPWKARIDLQAAAQRWVDHAISSTINVPEDTLQETIAEIYMYAWATGCKGITVYRDRCRDGVLFTESPKKLVLTETNAIKRPEILPARKHGMVGYKPKEEVTILIGLLDNKPFEVFAVLGNIESDNLSIQKHPRKDTARYSLLEVNNQIIKNINLASDPDLAAVTRLVSLNLRHGTPIQYIVEQLQKAKTTWFTSFPARLARILKDYIPDGTKSNNCPQCNSNQLRYQEGCLICPDCGFSKCA